MTELGGFVRHRDRMVQESVYEDLKDTLIACRWVVGTTSRPVLDPADPGSGPVSITTGVNDVLKLAGGVPLFLIDYFPQAELDANKTEPNTFALDNGTADDLIPLEIGSNAAEQVYTFTMAFWAKTDALGLAVMNDLRDRYNGRIVRNETVALFDYNMVSLTDPICRMDIDRFQYSQNTDQVAPAEVSLFFGQLVITDFVDAAN